MLSPRMEISSIYFITGAEDIAFRITLPFPNLNDLKCKGWIYILLKIDVYYIDSLAEMSLFVGYLSRTIFRLASAYGFSLLCIMN